MLRCKFCVMDDEGVQAIVFDDEGQCKREQTLKELEKPMYDEEMMSSYIRMIKEKLHISEEEFLNIMKKECHSHEEFKSCLILKCFAKH